MRKRLLILVVLAVAAGVLLFAYFSNNPGAGTNGTTKPAPQKLAFEETNLINRGVTSSQMDSLETVLGQYLNSQDKVSGQVDFNSIQRASTNPQQSTPFSELSFVIQLDGRPLYKAKLDSFSTSAIRLYLYTLDGNTLLYDSQNVGGSPNQP